MEDIQQWLDLLAAIGVSGFFIVAWREERKDHAETRRVLRTVLMRAAELERPEDTPNGSAI